MINQMTKPYEQGEMGLAGESGRRNDSGVLSHKSSLKKSLATHWQLTSNSPTTT